MGKTNGNWASIIAIGIAISSMPAAARTESAVFSDRQSARQMTVDLVIPFGGAVTKNAQNLPRLQLGMAYYPRSGSIGPEYNLWRPREQQVSTIGFTLDRHSALLLNGKPITAPGRKAALNTIETVGVVVGGLVLIAGGVLLYADSVFEEGPGN